MPPNPGAKKMAGYTSYSLNGILASHEDLLISLARGITVIDCSVDMACVLGLHHIYIRVEGNASKPRGQKDGWLYQLQPQWDTCFP